MLDHLATRLVEGGDWSIKKMIRSIVLSRTYQLESQVEPAFIEADPENRYYALHLRRRLDAESLRDAILAVSGQLDDQPTAGSVIRLFDVLVNHAGTLHEPSNHRSIYLCQLRNSPPPELAAFDLRSAIKVANAGTDETGKSAIDGKIYFRDLHATIFHLLGLSANGLIYRHAGRDHRRTGPEGGRVVSEIFA